MGHFLKLFTDCTFSYKLLMTRSRGIAVCEWGVFVLWEQNSFIAPVSFKLITLRHYSLIEMRFPFIIEFYIKRPVIHKKTPLPPFPSFIQHENLENRIQFFLKTIMIKRWRFAVPLIIQISRSKDQFLVKFNYSKTS